MIMSEEKKGPIYWHRPRNCEEGEIIDTGPITFKNGVAVNTYEQLRDGGFCVGILRGDEVHLFPIKEISLEGDDITIQLGEEKPVSLEGELALKYFDLEQKFIELGEIYRDIGRLRIRLQSE